MTLHLTEQSATLRLRQGHPQLEPSQDSLRIYPNGG